MHLPSFSQYRHMMVLYFRTSWGRPLPPPPPPTTPIEGAQPPPAPPPPAPPPPAPPPPAPPAPKPPAAALACDIAANWLTMSAPVVPGGRVEAGLSPPRAPKPLAAPPPRPPRPPMPPISALIPMPPFIIPFIIGLKMGFFGLSISLGVAYTIVTGFVSIWGTFPFTCSTIHVASSKFVMITKPAAADLPGFTGSTVALFTVPY
mmetsp:Transcript_22917/g.51572  ORF Transcript_22917/g.51572 Transcript_22917/m.51572 type:complete len:204 (-) Transcript_22917:167-778(-)